MLVLFQAILSIMLGLVGGLCLLAVQTIFPFIVAFLFGIFFFVISTIISFISFDDCHYMFNSVAQVSTICAGSAIVSLIILCMNIK